MAFHCTICEQESTRICVECTKDACDNHLCEMCKCCSDCCSHEVRLEERPSVRVVLEAAQSAESATTSD
jgi:hypothetical protein